MNYVFVGRDACLRDERKNLPAPSLNVLSKRTPYTLIRVSCFISLLERHIKPSVQLETAKRKPRFREEREKKEEIISRNCLPHHKKASSFPNTHEAVRLHFLPMLSRYSRMSKTVQHAGTAPFTPRHVAF